MSEPPRSDDDKLQRDIEEALRQGGADRLPSEPREPSPLPRRSRFDWRPRSPGQVILAGIVLLGLSYFGLAGAFAAVVSPVGLVLLLLGAATWLFRPRSTETYWRGRRIDLEEPESWWTRLYRSIYRQR